MAPALNEFPDLKLHHHHLGRLLDAGMVVSERGGRFVYYRIASDEVAEVLEQMSSLSPTDHLYRGGNDAAVPELVARTCYNHIAGRLGVLIAQSLFASGSLIERGNTARIATPAVAFLCQIGVLPDQHLRSKLPSAKCCLDWSERRKHLTGPFGTLLFQGAIANGWLKRQQGSRALRITDEGF